MATPRKNLFDPASPVTCHCISRCVRREFLLDDPRWFRHLRERLTLLVSLFAIDVLEWVLMSNHIHLVLSTHPLLVASWSDQEVAERWRTLSPDYHWRRNHKVPYHLPAQDEEIRRLLSDRKQLAACRRKLADISTFHKFLKQRIAAMINDEANTSGPVWESKFKTIVATDLETVIAHMVYVALNPVRAGIASTVEECSRSSIAARIEELKNRIKNGEFGDDVERARAKLDRMPLGPALPCSPGPSVASKSTLSNGTPNPWRHGAARSIAEGLSAAAYFHQIDRLARIPGPTRGSIRPEAPTLLSTLLRGIERSQRLKRPGSRATRTHRIEREPTSPILLAVASLLPPMEEALARGVGNAIGNFSGNEHAIRTHARELGHRSVLAIFDTKDGSCRRRVFTADARRPRAAA